TNIIFETAILLPTTNAPANAAGLAVLSNARFPEATTVAGFIWPTTNAPTLNVGVEGLLPGTYTVTITDTATNSYTLGTMDVITHSNIVVTTNWGGDLPGTFTAGHA